MGKPSMLKGFCPNGVALPCRGLRLTIKTVGPAYRVACHDGGHDTCPLSFCLLASASLTLCATSATLPAGVQGMRTAHWWPRAAAFLCGPSSCSTVTACASSTASEQLCGLTARHMAVLCSTMQLPELLPEPHTECQSCQPQEHPLMLSAVRNTWLLPPKC